jgi:hypothetical protein
MAEWIKDPTTDTDAELWHRVAEREETGILVMACEMRIPESAVRERGSEAPAIYFEHPDCREADGVTH